MARGLDPGMSARNVLFAHLVRRPEPDIDLAAAALLLAEDDEPGLDLPAYLARLDRMGEAVRARIGDHRGRHAPLFALSEYLFVHQGFRGNREDYYDPRNSYLHEVLERKVGIPISLAVVFLEVGWRLGLNLEGVAFPGHFLVRYVVPDGIAVLDVFDSGRILSQAELSARVKVSVGPDAELSEEHVAPAAKRQILTRMLTNLRLIFRRAGDLRRELHMVEKLAILSPEDKPLHDQQAELRHRAIATN